MAPPLTLESFNRIVFDIVRAQMLSAKPEPTDVTVCDFNQVIWHVSTPEGEETPTKLNVSVATSCWSQVQAVGLPYFKRVYGPMLQPRAEPNYDVTITIDISKKAEMEEAMKMARTASRLARNILASVFHHFAGAAEKRASGTPLLQVDYRPGESIWFRQVNDRITVIFSINFDDPDDVVIGRVFMTEIGKLVQGAPSCDVYLKDPPSELAGIRGLNAHGYVAFLLESRHYAPAKREPVADVLMTFRNYLHYHIKCSKAYLHIRMRTRVESLLQVLNRAKQEPPAQLAPHQAGGAPKRTFVRKPVS